MPDGTLSVGTGGEVVDIPLYDPSTLDTPAVRVAHPNGILAARLHADPPRNGRYPVRVGINGTVYGLDTSTGVLLADFEDGNWPGAWSGETGDYTVTSNDPIRGSYSLRPTTEFGQVAYTGDAASRGQSYSCLVKAGPNANVVWLMANAQSTGSYSDDLYATSLNWAQDELSCRRVASGNQTELAVASVSLSRGTVYQAVVDVDTDRVRSRLLDADGNTVATTAWTSDTTHAGGYAGVYTGRNPSGTRFDQLTEHPLGDP